MAVCCLLGVAVLAFPAHAERAGSEIRSVQHGFLDAGGSHSCAVLDNGAVRCWGFGNEGRLGYGNFFTIGDDESPATAGPVSLGPGRAGRAVAAGTAHSCAVLDDGSVRCWGEGDNGRLGYGNTDDIGDNEAPSSGGPVDLGGGRTARAITAGHEHTCALLDDATVRCWGRGAQGRLGYGLAETIGDDEAPGSRGPVDLGAGRTARAVAAGFSHTCAVLDDGSVRCWGNGFWGQLGYGNRENVGDSEAPGSVAPVDLGPGRTARAITAGGDHTCALLDNGSVRCWGRADNGKLGYGDSEFIGDDEKPSARGPVNLGVGRTAIGLGAGDNHNCAVLDDGSVRCWGDGNAGKLGYGNTDHIGDNELPGSVGPVDLGGRTARAITAGSQHTCALLDTGSVLCWGFGDFGQLGYGNRASIGDNEPAGSASALDLGRRLFATTADLSLTLTLDRPTATVGEEVRLTATLANGGPDASGPVVVSAPLPSGLELRSASATQGSYDAGAGLWRLPGLASGSGGELQTVARVIAAGNWTAATEVASAEAADPDSVPGNGLAGEDDRGSVILGATALPPPDTRPPRFAMGGFPAKLSRRNLLRRGVRGNLTPDEPSRFHIALLGSLRGTRIARAGDVVLSERSLPLAGSRRKVTLKIARRLRPRLARKLKLTLRITATDAAGNRTTRSRRIRVR